MTMVLVVGPPCGGKSTFAKTHAQPGDTIIDFDDIREELGVDRYDTSPAVLNMAKAIWTDRINTPRAGTTWVIWANPTKQQRASLRQTYGATVVLVWSPMKICLERAQQERPGIWEMVIRRWFATWKPSTSHPERIVHGFAS